MRSSRTAPTSCRQSAGIIKSRRMKKKLTSPNGYKSRASEKQAARAVANTSK